MTENDIKIQKRKTENKNNRENKEMNWSWALNKMHFNFIYKATYIKVLNMAQWFTEIYGHCSET